MSVDANSIVFKRLRIGVLFLFAVKFIEVFVIKARLNATDSTFIVITLALLITTFMQMVVNLNYISVVYVCLLVFYVLLNYSRSSHFSALLLVYFIFVYCSLLKLDYLDQVDLIKYLLALIYLFSALNKSNFNFLSGWVIFSHSHLQDLFSRISFGFLGQALLVVMSIFVVLIELFFSFCLLTNRFTPRVLSLALIFHALLVLMMNEGSFVILTELIIFNSLCVILLLFIYGNGVNPLYVVIWDGGCEFCASTINILKRLDFLGRLLFISNIDKSVLKEYGVSEEDSMLAVQVINPKSHTRSSGFYGFRELFFVLLPFAFFAPLLNLAFVERLGDFVYKRIAMRRSCKYE
jgi:predicted DCC family thiol-disulfide oxidoreductase YuxK